MFKRLFWLAVGTGLGFGSSYFLSKLLKRQVQKYSPQRISSGLGDALKEFGSDLRVAVNEGREAMNETERTLVSELQR